MIKVLMLKLYFDKVLCGMYFGIILVLANIFSFSYQVPLIPSITLSCRAQFFKRQVIKFLKYEIVSTNYQLGHDELRTSSYIF